MNTNVTDSNSWPAFVLFVLLLITLAGQRIYSGEDYGKRFQSINLKLQVQSMQQFCASVIRKKIPADIEEVFAEDRTPLLIASECGSIQDLAAILDRNPNLEARDSRGMTALILAVRTSYCRPQVIKLLLKSGVDVNARDHSGMTALCHVEQKRCLYHNEILSLLKKAGAEGCD